MKVIAVFATTVNGTIALSADDRVDWTSREDKIYFKELTMKIGTVIMGRKTHEAIGRPLPERLNIVWTRNPDAYRKLERENLRFLSSDPVSLLEQLKKEGISQVCLIGGAETFAAFASKSLVDELHLTYEPILCSGSMNLGSYLSGCLELKLIELVRLRKATVMIYEVEK